MLGTFGRLLQGAPGFPGHEASVQLGAADRWPRRGHGHEAIALQTQREEFAVHPAVRRPNLEAHHVGALVRVSDIPVAEDALAYGCRMRRGDGEPGIRNIPAAVGESEVQHVRAARGSPYGDAVRPILESVVPVLVVVPVIVSVVVVVFFGVCFGRAGSQNASGAGRVQGSSQSGQGELREGTRDVEPARAHCVVVARGAEIRRALTDQPAQVGVLEVGVGRQQQRHRAADMGRRHRGARRAHIVRAYREGRRTLVGRRSEGKDIAPGHVDPDRSARAASGRRHVHPPAEIRESLGGPIVLARGGHGDDLPHILRAIGHHVGIAIARRGDDHCPHGMNPAHDLLGQGIARACGAARPTRVDHPRPVVGGVEDRAPEVRIESLALGGKALEGHDARLGGDAGDSDAVIRHRGDGARDMRAVATVIEGVRVSHVQRSIVKAVQISVDGVCEIESPEIVDEAVAVVIDAVPIGRVHPAVGVEVFAGIDPDVCRDVRVEIIESGIHHGHHHAFALGEGPSLGGAHAFQSPEIVEVLVPTARRVKEGVVGREGCLVQLVGVVTLDPGDVGVFAIERQCGLGGHALTDLHAVDVGEVRRRRSALAAGAAPSASSSLLLHLLL